MLERRFNIEDQITCFETGVVGNGVIIARNHLLENVGITQKLVSVFDERTVSKNRLLF